MYPLRKVLFLVLTLGEYRVQLTARATETHAVTVPTLKNEKTGAYAAIFNALPFVMRVAGKSTLTGIFPRRKMPKQTVRLTAS